VPAQYQENKVSSRKNPAMPKRWSVDGEAHRCTGLGCAFCFGEIPEARGLGAMAARLADQAATPGGYHEPIFLRRNHVDVLVELPAARRGGLQLCRRPSGVRPRHKRGPITGPDVLAGPQ
jgi:hypothetical protein